MRKLMMTAALGLMALAGTPALAADAPADTQAITANINGVADALNRLDVPKFVGLHTEAPLIIDEFAPFAWQGKGAVAGWLNDFGGWAKGAGVTGTKVAMGAPEALNIAGNTAYATAPVTLTFAGKDGKSFSTLGQFAFVMTKQDGAWKIASWAYTRTGDVK